MQLDAFFIGVKEYFTWVRLGIIDSTSTFLFGYQYLNQ